MTLAEALRTAHGTSRADTGLHITGITGADWIGQLLTQSPDAQVQALVQPTGFQGQLRPYQVRGLQWMASCIDWGSGHAWRMTWAWARRSSSSPCCSMSGRRRRGQGRGSPGPTLLFAPTSVDGQLDGARCSGLRRN